MKRPGQPPLPIDDSTPQGQLGQILRDRREALGYSTRDASALLGISHQALSRLEHGIDTPRWGTLDAICAAYRLTVTLRFPGPIVTAKGARGQGTGR